MNAGTPLANALQVNANVESTSILSGITTTVAGDVLIGSAAISLANDISTAATSGNITFTGTVTLTNGVALSTGAAAGNILFSSTINGAQTLGLTAGTGSITFTGAVGGGTRLGAISIASATNVLANAITAASLSQAAGSGTTSLNGAVNTNTATGVSLTGTNLAVNAGISTTNSGKVTFNQSGTAAIAVLGDILADGAVSLTAIGGITTAGDVITTDDDVTFASKTTLNGPVAVSTGAAAGNILFSSTIDGAQTLALTAGTGNVTFDGAVGGGTPLAGISLGSAASVTAASTIKLDGTPGLAIDGITIAAGVNNVSFVQPGSDIRNFSGSGVVFQGSSADSRLAGFTIASNQSNGVRFAPGDYAGTVLSTNVIRDNGNPTTHVGNGILVEGSNLIIGWTATAGEPNTVGNTITGNAKNGIEIKGAGAQDNTILSNSIYLNGYVDTSVLGQKTVVGEGIALTDGGNGGQAAPVILRVVDDASSNLLRVLVYVPAASGEDRFYVQLFANTPDDERGIFPADTNGFEGRTYTGDKPAQEGSAVTNVKPAIAGTLLTGNQLEMIEIPPDRVPAGNWITATATLVSPDDDQVPLSTSPFSAGVQRQDAPVIAVGKLGQGTWSQEFSYSLLSENQLRVTGLSPGFTTVLAGLVNTPIVITPAQAAAAGNVARTVVNGQLEAGGSVVLNLAPGGSLPAGGGTLVLGAATLPAAELYDTSNPAEALFAVGPVRISSALASAGVPAANANAFVNRYQGGLRVASTDLDGDGFADLVTAPGAAPAHLAGAFGDAARVITIYNGNPAGAWQSASVNVGSVFGGTYTGGFLVALGDVRPENAGSGSAVAELIVASTDSVAVFEVQVPARGAQPVINPVPVATWTSPVTVTGIAAGDFSADPQDLVVVATTTTNGNALPSDDMATATVRTFAVGGTALVPQQEFRITSEVQNGPPGSGFMQNVFLNGATLAVGDIDGTLTSEAGQPRLKPELVLASQAMGLGNFRVLANELVAGGSQAEINTALGPNGRYSQQPRQARENIWRPTGGPDYFVGTSVNPATATGANAGLAVAVVDADGRANGKAEVFASLNVVQYPMGHEVRRLFWAGFQNWQSAGEFEVVFENAGDNTLNAGAGPVSFTAAADGTRSPGFISLGRIMIEVSRMDQSLFSGSQSRLNLLMDPRFNSIQTIAAAGYPSFLLPSVYLGGVPGTPRTGLPGSAGIGTVTDPGGLYQAAAQNAFENNPILAATFGRQGTAIFDQAASGTLPSNTPGVADGFLFYDYVVGASGPVLPVGSDGPAVWVPYYNYQAVSGNVLRLGGLTVTEVNRLVAMRGRQIFISGNGRSEVATATVANVRRIGGRAVNMVLRDITSPGGSLAGTSGRLEPGPLTLPTARLYDAGTGEVVLDLGAEAIAASLEAAGVTPAAADAFVSRFQGGLRVASGDVDGDGFADLVTAPGAAPAIPAATFGTATRIVTIYSGNPAATWESASLDVSAAFPGYSGGFQVTLGDVLPEVPGSGSGVLELIVAGTNKVAVYELAIPEPGGAPVIAATPAAVWAVGPRSRITGLAAGDFSAAESDEVVVATAAPAGTVVRTFSVAGGNFAPQSTFRARSYVEGDPQRRLRDVFANGASLAVGDIDGAVDGKPELVLAATAGGLANFRVLSNELVATGSQAAINQALSLGNGFTRSSRSQYATVGGQRVWQPAGGPDYFAGIARLPNAIARGINAPLSVAVVNATGATAAGQVFAALGPQNTTANMIRRLAWSSLEASWSGTDAFQAQPAGRTRFPVGGGLLLG